MLSHIPAETQLYKHRPVISLLRKVKLSDFFRRLTLTKQQTGIRNDYQPRFHAEWQSENLQVCTRRRLPKKRLGGRLAASWNEFNYKNLGTPGINIDNSRKTPATIPENVRIAVIDVRNVGGVPHYYYMSNETAFAPIEQWSITKYSGCKFSDKRS